MFFLKNNAGDSELAAKGRSPTERRGKPRYAVSPQFQLNATLSVDTSDTAPSPDGIMSQGWSSKCRLLDCSEQGVRVQVDPSVKMQAGDLRALRLKVEDFDLNVPCRVANINPHAAGMIFGLMLDLEDEANFDAYWQLLEAVVLGSSLKLHSRTAKPDESGYLLEHYACSRPARLSIWRHPVNETIAAFEFRLKRQVVRAVAGNQLEFLTEPGSRPAQPAGVTEIQRLFSRMVPNLSQTVPQDVREFLLHYATDPGTQGSMKRRMA